MEELISVIIPVNNSEQYLDRCLISVVSQSYSNLEIILVNDGSKDKSLEICNKWLNIDERIKVINNKCEGISKAKNIGIKESKGKYISFVCSKDYVHVDYIKILYNILVKNNADIAVCGVYETNKTNPINTKFEINEEKIIHSKDILKDKNLVNNNICNKLYKKSIFLDIKFSSEKQYEDIGVFNKILYYSNRIAKVENKLYFRLEDDISSIFSEQQLGILDILMESYNFYIEKGETIYANYILKDYLDNLLELYKKIYSLEKFCYLKKYLRRLYIKYYRNVVSKVEMNFIYKMRYILYRFIPETYILISNNK